MALQQTSTEWARIANTTLSEYIDGETNLLMRQRKVFAMLQKKGRIKYGQSGDGFVWTPRVKRANVQVNNLEQTLQFPRVNRWKNAFLDMVGYAVTDAVTKRERLKNKSGQAIVKVFSGVGERCGPRWLSERHLRPSLDGAGFGRWRNLEHFDGHQLDVAVRSRSL